MKTPDFTPAAIGAAVILAWTNVLVLFKLNLSPSREGAIESLVNGAAVIGFLAHDAYVRKHRAQVQVAREYSPQPLTGPPVHAPAPEGEHGDPANP